MNTPLPAQVSPGQLLLGAIGMMALGALLAVVLAGGLHGALHAMGAWRTRRGAGPKFSWWLALGVLGLGALAGGLGGAAAGCARGALAIAQDLGSTMAEEKVQIVLRQAGLTNFARLEVAKLREFVDKAESAPLPPLEQLEWLRPRFEEARGKLLPAVKALLDTHAKDGRLVLHEAVNALWPQVLDELVRWERRFRWMVIIGGVLLVLGLEAALALIFLVVRLIRAPLPGHDPAPPKP